MNNFKIKVGSYEDFKKSCQEKMKNTKIKLQPYEEFEKSYQEKMKKMQYINRNKLLNYLHENINNKDIINEIENFPFTYVFQPKEGEWIIKKIADFSYKAICSNCRFTKITDFKEDDEIVNFYFCPRCGAKMYSEE